jgi:uncharacterized metal-binding protein
LTIALITCSGISNTGRLTTESALTLLQRKPGQYAWIQARQSAATLETDIGDAEEVIVIDGCTDCCARKIVTASRIEPQRHIIATEIGIRKNGMADVQYHEIEAMVREILKENSP